MAHAELGWMTADSLGVNSCCGRRRRSSKDHLVDHEFNVNHLRCYISHKGHTPLKARELENFGDLGGVVVVRRWI